MANYRLLKLRIHGKVAGRDMTPLTLPMFRLASYLADFANLLGFREYVHFREVVDGSATPVALVEMEKDSKVRERVRLAAIGRGPKDANGAYEELNRKFAEDDGYGEILEVIDDHDAKLVEFPGKRIERHPIYGPIKESAFVQGELRRVGGEEPTIPVWLKDADGKMYYCDASKALAKELAPYLFQDIRLNGIATWVRDEMAAWQLLNFEVQSYSLLTSESVATVISDLRAVPGNDWNKFADPLEELQRIRHGGD